MMRAFPQVWGLGGPSQPASQPAVDRPRSTSTVGRFSVRTRPLYISTVAPLPHNRHVHVPVRSMRDHSETPCRNPKPLPARTSHPGTPYVPVRDGTFLFQRPKPMQGEVLVPHPADSAPWLAAGSVGEGRFLYGRSFVICDSRFVICDCEDHKLEITNHQSQIPGCSPAPPTRPPVGRSGRPWPLATLPPSMGVGYPGDSLRS